MWMCAYSFKQQVSELNGTNLQTTAFTYFDNNLVKGNVWLSLRGVLVLFVSVGNADVSAAGSDTVWCINAAVFITVE